MQSLVASLSLNNLTPLTIIFSSVYLNPLTKIISLRVDKKQYPSGLAKIGPLRIRKNFDPSGLGPLRFVKLTFRIRSPMLLCCLYQLGKVCGPSLDLSGLKLTILFDNSH